LTFCRTLLIFDEVQEVPKALASLKYFNENAPQYHISQLAKENKKFMYGRVCEGAQAKSLKVYREKYEPELAIRTSMATHRDEGQLLNLPLWAIETMQR
jgi:hypothetical protein